MAKKRANLRRYRNFYLEWLCRALRGAFVGLGFEGGGEIMRGIVLWACAVLALYLIDWRDLPIIGTIDAEPAHEVRFGLCVALAIIIVFSAFFIWHLIVQPVRIYREAWDKIDDDEKLIAAIGDSEADRRFLSDAHAAGFRLYRAKVDCDDPASIEEWKHNMDQWVEKVKSHLSARWSISALHEFKNLGSAGGSLFRRAENDKLEEVLDANGFSILCTYSAYLTSVDDIIRHGEYAHLGDVQEILLKREMFEQRGIADENSNIH